MKLMEQPALIAVEDGYVLDLRSLGGVAIFVKSDSKQDTGNVSYNVCFSLDGDKDPQEATYHLVSESVYANRDPYVLTHDRIGYFPIYPAHIKLVGPLDGRAFPSKKKGSNIGTISFLVYDLTEYRHTQVAELPGAWVDPTIFLEGDRKESVVILDGCEVEGALDLETYDHVILRGSTFLIDDEEQLARFRGHRSFQVKNCKFEIVEYEEEEEDDTFHIPYPIHSRYGPCPKIVKHNPVVISGGKTPPGTDNEELPEVTGDLTVPGTTTEPISWYRRWSVWGTVLLVIGMIVLSFMAGGSW